MTKRTTTFLSTIALIITAAITIPRVLPDAVKLDPQARTIIRSDAQTQLNAPSFEFLTLPIPRIQSYNPTTKVAVVGMYSWFGVRVATVRLDGCGPAIATDPHSFECKSGQVIDAWY